jgi:uncharacterized protein YeaO (DUF488 family)
MDWKADRINWEEYIRRYNQEMADQQEEIVALPERVGRGTITLLCFEKEDYPHCHRHLLERMIEARL